MILMEKLLIRLQFMLNNIDKVENTGLLDKVIEY